MFHGFHLTGLTQPACKSAAIDEMEELLTGPSGNLEVDLHRVIPNLILSD